MSAVALETKTLARRAFEQNGFLIGPTLVDDRKVAAGAKAMDEVLSGSYDTGRAPVRRSWNPGDDPTRLVKIDQPQVSSSGIQRLISNPEIGRAAAEITGAKMIQVWNVQMLFKPPGSALNSVGWHQDQQYWLRWWTPESVLFTCWLALSDVTADAGPVKFVSGSHTWGMQGDGDFFQDQIDLQRESINVPAGQQWTETPGVIPPGAATFHHCLTYHGSGPNTSGAPRRSLAIHLRTENSEPDIRPELPDNERAFVAELEDPLVSPVIYDVR